MLSGGDCKAGRLSSSGLGMAWFGRMHCGGTGEWISTAEKEKDGVGVHSREQIPENTEYCAVDVCGSRVEQIRLNAGVGEAAWHNCPGRSAPPYC